MIEPPHGGEDLSAEIRAEFDVATGAQLSRHIDWETAQLDRLARTWLDVQQTRKAIAQREIGDAIVSSFLKAEQHLHRELTKTLRQHPLWPWLSQFPGLGGAHTAAVIGRIGDPRRFPGQRCSAGHYLPPLYAAGSPCPLAAAALVIEKLDDEGHILDADKSDDVAESQGDPGCVGVMLPPRTTTGVRSLWHWLGLHADEKGRSPRKRKGQRCTWDPRARASVMQPGGIAEQIVRLNVPVYADRYRAEKARLILRVTDDPLRPFQADRIARKIAAKTFLGDLLTEWKRLAAGA